MLYGFIVDFYCPSKKLVIEIDGPSHKGKEAQDKLRDNILARHGIKTLRFSSDQIYEDLPTVVQKIKFYLEQSSGSSITNENLSCR